jgi:Glu-tRNA(Gln) amidotransferase subunit E-like FAD-binding protein
LFVFTNILKTSRPNYILMDYKKVGFMSGLELHVQLNTDKLFCNCPSLIRRDNPSSTIHRELHPMAGETGKIDIAALYEQKKRLTYTYELYNNTTCLLELDEEPPHLVNDEALVTALTVSKMFNCSIPEVLQVMRKTVVDGSNTSGFQRTVLVGKDGWIKLKNGKKIGINYLILEEDAGRRTAEDKKTVTFRLDRLGIPLLEIVTAPDMKTPSEVQEVAETIGNLVTSTGKKMRGLGSIRQDINISIKGHPRIEIKGVQDLRHIPKVVDIEIQRQQSELKNKVKTFQHVRTARDDFTTKFLRPLPGSARMYPETDLPLVYINSNLLKQAKIPESFEDKKKRFLKLGLNLELTSQLITHPRVSFFEKSVAKYKKVNPKLIATTILALDTEVRKKLGLEHLEFLEDDISAIFEQLNKGAIAKEALVNIFSETAQGTPLSAVLSKFKLMSDSDLKKEIERIKKANKNAPEGKLTGIVISALRGKADPQKIIKLMKA